MGVVSQSTIVHQFWLDPRKFLVVFKDKWNNVTVFLSVGTYRELLQAVWALLLVLFSYKIWGKIKHAIKVFFLSQFALFSKYTNHIWLYSWLIFNCFCLFRSCFQCWAIMTNFPKPPTDNQLHEKLIGITVTLLL